MSVVSKQRPVSVRVCQRLRTVTIALTIQPRQCSGASTQLRAESKTRTLSREIFALMTSSLRHVETGGPSRLFAMAATVCAASSVSEKEMFSVSLKHPRHTHLAPSRRASSQAGAG